MNRFSILILIAMIAALFNLNSTHAATTTSETRSIFVAQFDNGEWFGAMLALDGDSVTAIKFNVVSGESFEDMLPAYGSILTATVDMSERGPSGIMHMFSTEYNRMLDLEYNAYTDSTHIVGYIEAKNGYSTGTMDGAQAQFRGFVQNGETIVLRYADAYSVTGTGWLVQNQNLISYTVSNGESTTHTIYIPLVLH